MSTKDDIKKLIKENNRRLQKLKEQKAKLGVHTPPHTLTEIEDVEKELEDLQLRLTNLDMSGESLPQERIFEENDLHYSSSNSSEKVLDCVQFIHGKLINEDGEDLHGFTNIALSSNFDISLTESVRKSVFLGNIQKPTQFPGAFAFGRIQHSNNPKFVFSRFLWSDRATSRGQVLQTHYLILDDKIYRELGYNFRPLTNYLQSKYQNNVIPTHSKIVDLPNSIKAITTADEIRLNELWNYLKFELSRDTLLGLLKTLFEPTKIAVYGFPETDDFESDEKLALDVLELLVLLLPKQLRKELTFATRLLRESSPVRLRFNLPNNIDIRVDWNTGQILYPVAPAISNKWLKYAETVVDMLWIDDFTSVVATTNEFSSQDLNFSIYFQPITASKIIENKQSEPLQPRQNQKLTKKHIGVFGPKNSGKTTYLGMLYHAAMYNPYIKLAPADESAKDFILNACDFLEKGFFPSPTDIPIEGQFMYRFNISRMTFWQQLKWRLFRSLPDFEKSEKTLLEFMDIAGEWFAYADSKDLSKQYPDAARAIKSFLMNCQAGLLFYDPTLNTDSNLADFLNMLTIFENTSPTLAICISKVDKSNLWDFRHQPEMLAEKYIAPNIRLSIKKLCKPGNYKYFAVSSVGVIKSKSTQVSNIEYDTVTNQEKIREPNDLYSFNLVEPLYWILQKI